MSSRKQKLCSSKSGLQSRWWWTKTASRWWCIMEAPQILPFLSTVLVIVMVRLKAEQKGQLRDGNVPCVSGFMEWAGLKGRRIAADYEYLYGHHPDYFKSQEEVKAAVELVL